MIEILEQTEEYQILRGKYLYTITGDEIGCSCLGYQFRHKCKHIKALKTILTVSGVD